MADTFFDSECREFVQLNPKEIPELSPEKALRMKAAGLIMLQMDEDDESQQKRRAHTAEKMLYFSESRDECYIYSEELIHATMKMGCAIDETKVTRTTHHAQDEDDEDWETELTDVVGRRLDYTGQPERDITAAWKEIEKLPDVFSPGLNVILMVIIAALVGVAALVLFNPTVGSWLSVVKDVPQWLMVILALIFIVVMFTAGLMAALGVMIAMALLAAFPFLRKAVIILILGLFAAFCIYLFVENLKLLRVKDAAQIRAKKLASLKRESMRLHAFADVVLKNLDDMLSVRPNTPVGISPEENDKLDQTVAYMRVYYRNLRNALAKLDADLPES